MRKNIFTVSNKRYEQLLDARTKGGDECPRDFSVSQIGNEANCQVLEEFFLEGHYEQVIKLALKCDTFNEWVPRPDMPETFYVGTRSLFLRLTGVLEAQNMTQDILRLWRDVLDGRKRAYWSALEQVRLANEDPSFHFAVHPEKLLPFAKESYFIAAQDFMAILKRLNLSDEMQNLEREIATLETEKPKKPAKKRVKPDPRKMNEEIFWQVIDETCAGTEDGSEHAEKLTAALEAFKARDIIEFEKILRRKMADAYRNDLWAVATTMMGFCSDDSFEYFRAWLISRGHKVFEAALKNPEHAADGVDPADDTECEELLYTASNAYEAKKGEDLLEKIEMVDPVLIGEPWEEHDLPLKFPELCKRFRFKPS